MRGKAFVTVGVLLGAVACGSSSGGTIAPPSVPATQAEPSAAPTTLTLAAKYHDWLVLGGQNILDSIGKDSGDISTAGGDTDSAALETAAVSLKADVDRAQEYTPMPDPIAQREWVQALEDSGSAATHYITGASTMDAAEIDAGTASLNQATSHLKVVGELISRAG